MEGVATSIYLKVIGHLHEKVESQSYCLELVDRKGRRHKVHAFGVESISREAPYSPTQELEEEFPELSREQLSRTGGEVDLLLGADVLGLHPITQRSAGHRRVMASQFGSGALLMGPVPGLPVEEADANAVRLARGRWELPEGATVSHLTAVPTPYEEFEDLEAATLRACRACRRNAFKCPECSFCGGNLTLEEREAVDWMQDRMYHDSDKNVIRVSYPLRPEAERQPNNFRQVRAIQEKIEARVAKDGLTAQYAKEIEKMIAEGSVRELTKEEMGAWR